MTPWRALTTAAIAVTRNALRAFLATLGIVVAVAAVVATIAAGEGARLQVAHDMAALGTNLLFVGSGTGRGRGSAANAGRALVWADGVAIGGELAPFIEHMAPTMRYGAQAIFGGANWQTTLVGTTPAYFAARRWTFAHGQPFGPDADVTLQKQCVLGQTVARQLFHVAGDPAELALAIGDFIRIRGMQCQVVGILQPKGQSSWGGDQDDIIMLPYHTLTRRLAGLPDTAGLSFVVAANARTTAAMLAQQIRAALRQRHRLTGEQADDFTIFNVSELQRSANSQMRTLSWLLGSVAVISLAVGSIGIANVMLVTVTERTREVGLRMAVGARRRDVLRQFLAEASLLAAAGGVVGLGVGTGLATLAARTAGWPMALSWRVAAATLGITALAGIAAGLYPAWRASRLDPIEALRYG